MCGSGHRNLSPGAGPDWTDRSIFRKKPWRTGPPVRPPAGGRRPSSCRKRRFCAVFRPCRRRPHSPFLAPSRCKNGYKTSRQRNIISCISSRIGLRLSGTARGTAPGMAPKAGDVSQCVGKCHVLSWSDSLRPLHPHRSYRPERSDGPRSGDIFPVQRPGPKHRAGKISPLRLCSGQAASPRIASGAAVEMTERGWAKTGQVSGNVMISPRWPPPSLCCAAPLFPAHRPCRPRPLRRAGVRKPPPAQEAVCSYNVL